MNQEFLISVIIGYDQLSLAKMIRSLAITGIMIILCLQKGLVACKGFSYRSY